MNKKGFTLIESMITVGILAMIALISTTILTSLFKGSRFVAQNAERQELLGYTEFVLQSESQCDANFAGKDPAVVNTLTQLTENLTGGGSQAILSTASTALYANGSLKVTQITFGGTTAGDFYLFPSPDNLNGVAMLRITFTRSNAPQGDELGGPSRRFDIPIAVRLVPPGAAAGTPGTVDHCRFGTGSISVTDFLNIDSNYPAAAPPVGVNQSTAYTTNYNLVIGQPRDELYNIKLRTESGDVLAKDGNLYISRDTRSCSKRMCSNNIVAGGAVCANDNACNGGVAGPIKCVLTWVDCTAASPNDGDGKIQGNTGDVVVGFGEYDRMVSTFGPGAGGLGLGFDQMFLLGWQASTGRAGAVVPDGWMFNVWGMDPGAPGVASPAGIAATGNVYTNFMDDIGPVGGGGGTNYSSLVGFGKWQKMLEDADRFGVPRNRVFGFGWSDGALGTVAAPLENKKISGIVLPEGWGFSFFFQDDSGGGGGPLKPGFFDFPGNTRIGGNLNIKRTQGVAGWECSGAMDYSGIHPDGGPNHCGDGDLTIDGDASIGGDLTINGNVNITIGNLAVTNNITAGGTITASSDRNLKKEIKPLESSLSKINELIGVSYKWKDPKKDTKTQLGLIAQDVEKVYPELSYKDAKGVRSLNYLGFIAPIIESIKELTAKVMSLFTKIDTLNDEVKILKEENAALKELICESNPKHKLCIKK